MSTRRVLNSVAIVSVLFAASAFAQSARIEGNAVGADGKPSKNAEVRIQAEKTKTAPMTVKTDAKGHFAATNLPAGNYKVTLPNGATSTVTAKNNQTARVNLGTAATAKLQKNERWVWVPASTGSHMGGHYEKVADDGTIAGQPGAQGVDQMSGSQLTRMQQQGNIGRGGGTP